MTCDMLHMTCDTWHMTHDILKKKFIALGSSFQKTIEKSHMPERQSVIAICYVTPTGRPGRPVTQPPAFLTTWTGSHISHVTCPLSPVTCHLAPVTKPTAAATDPPPANSPIMHSRLVPKDPKTKSQQRKNYQNNEKSKVTYRLNRPSGPMQLKVLLREGFKKMKNE